MQYALVDGHRIQSRPKISGACPSCGDPLVPKCGSKVIWHWAHKAKLHCDAWWENETEWHRRWKACFPEEWREQVHVDPTGEKHIADVKTDAGLVVEFQNSPMDPVELVSRETFYGDMVWIVNGATFVERFFVLGRLPSMTAELWRDVVFYPQGRDKFGKIFWRRSENPHAGGPTPSMVRIHSIDEIQSDIDRSYVGHHFFDWVRPKEVWLGAKAPVYFDFGGDLLWNLQRIEAAPFRCIQAVRKVSVVTQWRGTYTPIREVVPLPGRAHGNGKPIDRGETAVLLAALP